MGSDVTIKIEDLIVRLGQTGSLQRLEARMILVDLGEDAVEPLTNAVYSDNVRLVANAVIVLGQIASPRSVPVIIACLDHPNSVVGMNAANALKHFSSEQAVDALVRHLPCASEMIQQSILNSLQINGTSDITPHILQFLHSAPNPDARYMAIRVLANVGDESVIPHIKQYLSDENDHVRNDAQITIDKLRNKSQE